MKFQGSQDRFSCAMCKSYNIIATSHSDIMRHFTVFMRVIALSCSLFFRITVQCLNIIVVHIQCTSCVPNCLFCSVQFTTNFVTLRSRFAYFDDQLFFLLKFKALISLVYQYYKLNQHEPLLVFMCILMVNSFMQLQNS